MDFLIAIDKNLKEKAEKLCVIECNHAKILKAFTYKTVDDIQRIIYNNIKNVIKHHSGIALYMDNNVYVPSLVISLLRHQCPFIFLNLQKPNLESLKKLNIKWMISYDNDENIKNLLNDAFLIGNIQIYDSEMSIWKIHDTVTLYENIVYVVETSGTTGSAKLICVEENCIASNIFALLEVFQLSEEIIYFGTPLTFDPSMIELFLSLISGSCLLLVDIHLKNIPKLILQAMFPENKYHKGVSFLQVVPSIFYRWNTEDIKFIFECSTLKYLIFGGEAFPTKVLNYLKENCPINVYNIYGITEVSCWASIYKVEDNNAEISLGTPLKGTFFEVHNDENVIITEGIGELFIGSTTRKCYINDEIGNYLPDVVFRATGDLVKINDGNVYYVSRANDIIKRYGHRINMIQVQNIIENDTGLECYMLWIQEASYLILFVKIAKFAEETKNKIIDKLRVKFLQILPIESVPDIIEIVSNFPLNTNGKLDRYALKNKYLNSMNLEIDSHKKPDEVFQNLLKKYLGLNDEDFQANLHKTFTQLGGNSVMVLQILNEYQSLTDSDYPKVFIQVLYEETLDKVLKLVKTMYNEVRLTKYQNIAYNYANIPQNIVVKWQYDLKACVDSTPAIIENRYVAIGSFAQIFTLLDISNGTPYLCLTLPGPIESSASSSINHDYVYIGCYDGNFYCISMHTKNIAWQYMCDDKIKCKAITCRNDKALVFGSYDKYVHCINVEDGQLLWKTFVEGSVTATPLYLKNSKCIVICTIMGKCVMLNEDSGNIIWAITLGCPTFSNSCILQLDDKNNFVVCATVNGRLLSINTTNGKIAWTFETNSEIYSSLVNYENSIIFGTNSGELHHLEASSTTCDTKFCVRLDGQIVSTPNVTDFYIIAATTRGTVFKIDKSGNILGYIKLMGEIFSSPILFNNSILIGCRDNNIYCLEIND